MKKYEILYDWPIDEIRRLTNSDIAESFAATLSEQDLSQFTSLTEQMRGLGTELAQAKAAFSHFSNWHVLRSCLKDFENQFTTFPEQSFSKFLLFVVLAEKLALIAEPLDEIIIDESKFVIREHLDSLPIPWFTRENNITFEDSVAVFSCADFDSLECEINSCNISPPFIFQFLAALVPLPNVPIGHAALLKNTTPAIDSAAINAFVRLVILASGKYIHSPRRYVAPLRVINPDVFSAGHLYQQWNEILYVLSEYNSRDEILLKYLTIYHVIENLMFKYPIIELERQNSGQMFSIRDFRRLYKQVEQSESTALKHLFTAVLKEEATNGVTFEARLVSRWNGLNSSLISNLEIVLGKLGIRKGTHNFRHTDFNTSNDCASYFSQMVYQTRCAIVHNKETEFHLTYASLDAALTMLIEEFLIPSLEEICFALIGKPNSKFWYSGEKLSLY